MKTLITVSENGTFSFKHGPLHRNLQKSGSVVDSCRGHDGLALKYYREKWPKCINNLLCLLIAWILEEVNFLVNAIPKTWKADYKNPIPNVTHDTSVNPKNLFYLLLSFKRHLLSSHCQRIKFCATVLQENTIKKVYLIPF